MAVKKLLEVAGRLAIEADEDTAELRVAVTGGAAGPIELAVPFSAAEGRELAAALLKWADAIEPTTRLRLVRSA
jgi:hypothetical protein